MTTAAFHLPTRPYTPIDAINRRAAALGSPGYMQATAIADYNGHRVSLHWNDYRGYYIAEYWWGGRVVLARGSFNDCLKAVRREYDRGALGSCAVICPREDDIEAIQLCCTEKLPEGDLPERPEWYTWRHTAAAQSVRDYANPNALRRHFDYELLIASETEKDYDAALTAKHGSAWTF